MIERNPVRCTVVRGALRYVTQSQVGAPVEARVQISLRYAAGLIGKVQLEKLLSDRALQLGDAFDLGRFHDEFLAAGSIPISLIRWQMTGNDDEIRKLW